MISNQDMSIRKLLIDIDIEGRMQSQGLYFHIINYFPYLLVKQTITMHISARSQRVTGGILIRKTNQ